MPEIDLESAAAAPELKEGTEGQKTLSQAPDVESAIEPEHLSIGPSKSYDVWGSIKGALKASVIGPMGVGKREAETDLKSGARKMIQGGPEEANAKSQNIYAIQQELKRQRDLPSIYGESKTMRERFGDDYVKERSKAIAESTGLSLHDVEAHFEEFARNPKITGIRPDHPSNKEYLGALMQIGVATGAVIDPIGTAVGFLAFSALDHLIPTEKWIPSDASNTARGAIELADFIVKGEIAGGFMHGLPGGRAASDATTYRYSRAKGIKEGDMMPRPSIFEPDRLKQWGRQNILEKFSYWKMKAHGLPTSFQITPEHLAKFETAFKEDFGAKMEELLGVKPETIEAAKKTGASIEIPAETIVKAALKDEPKKPSKSKKPRSPKTLYQFPERTITEADAKTLLPGYEEGQDPVHYGIKQMRAEIEEGTAGRKFVNQPDQAGTIEDTVAGYEESTFPEYFKNKGYTKKESLKVIDVFLENKPLTEKQKSLLTGLFESKIEHLKTEAERHAEYERRTKEEIEGSGVPVDEIEKAASDLRGNEEGSSGEKDAKLRSAIDGIESLVDESGNLTRGTDYIREQFLQGHDQENLEALKIWADKNKNPQIRRIVVDEVSAQLRSDYEKVKEILAPSESPKLELDPEKPSGEIKIGDENPAKETPQEEQKNVAAALEKTNPPYEIYSNKGIGYVVTGTPKIDPVEKFGLQPGDKVIQIGVPAKSGKETLNSRIDYWDAPGITYVGISKAEFLANEGYALMFETQTVNGEKVHIAYPFREMKGNDPELQTAWNSKAGPSTRIYRAEFKKAKMSEGEFNLWAAKERIKELKKMGADKLNPKTTAYGEAWERAQSDLIESDAARTQEIKNSIAEGEMILKDGKINGRKMSKEELEAVKRTVDNAKAKLPSYKKAEFGKPRTLKEQTTAMTDLERAAYEGKQGKLFGNEKGSVAIDAIPGVREIVASVETAGKMAKGIQETFAAPTLDKYSRMTAETLREQIAKSVRAYDVMEVSLARARNMFNKMDKAKLVYFMDAIETGAKQPTPELQTIADTIRNELDLRREKIQRLGTGKLQTFIDNYFPHIWKDPKKAQDVFLQMGSKRPFEGGKSFLKKRTIESIKDGIAAGLEPVSYNPVDLVLLKAREMDKYILAHETLNIMKSEGLAKFVAVGAERPEAWKKVDDNISTVYGSPEYKVKEYQDEEMMDALQAVLDSLGIKHERRLKIGGKALGYSQPGPIDPKTGRPGPGTVTTRTATPPSTVAHEGGHQLDEMFGLLDKFLGGKRPKADFILDRMAGKAKREGRLTDVQKLEMQKTINKELRDLADLKKVGAYGRKGVEKMATMLEAMIQAPDKFKKVAPNVYKMYREFLQSDPRLKPLLDIKHGIPKKVMTGTGSVGGMVINGYWYMPENAATVINNYLSPGLRGNTFFDLYRNAGNTLNQFQLSGLFHLGFTSLDACISRVALGFEKVGSGELKGVGDVVAGISGVPAITNLIKGDKLLNAWYGKPTDAKTALIAESMVMAGGRARMDSFYATTAFKNMQAAFKEGKVVKGIMTAPLAALEAITQPILSEIVPRQKLGVFFDLAQSEIERNPNMGHAELRKKVQDVWDSVDNRMGQLVYDNLFWHKTTKDLLMVSVRSVGWNLGTFRELGGGAIDTLKFVKDVASGKKAKFTHKMAYTMALPVVTGLYGAIYNYLHTGEAPQDLKDYFFPRNGKIDKNGKEQRVSLPSYMKDIYHYSTDPWKTVTNKVAPQNSMIAQMLDNKDFYGTEIRNEDDPIMQQIMDEMKFVGTSAIPFTARNVNKTGWSPEQLIGVMPSPQSVNMTKAEQAAQKFASAKVPVGSRTKENSKHAQDKAEILAKFMQNKDYDAVYKAADDGTITNREAEQLIKESEMSYLERVAPHLTVEEAIKVYKKANEKEKEILRDIIEKKYSNKMKKEMTPEQQARIEKLYEENFQ